MSAKLHRLAGQAASAAYVLGKALERERAGMVTSVIVLEFSPKGAVSASWSDMQKSQLVFMERVLRLMVDDELRESSVTEAPDEPAPAA